MRHRRTAPEIGALRFFRLSSRLLRFGGREEVLSAVPFGRTGAPEIPRDHGHRRVGVPGARVRGRTPAASGARVRDASSAAGEVRGDDAGGHP